MKNRLRIVKGSACFLMAFLCSLLFSHAQGLASARHHSDANPYSASQPTKSLTAVLEWLESTYNVNLSYDVELVKGKNLRIEEENLMPKGKKIKAREIELILKKALFPLGLSFKRIEKNYYLIKERQNETKVRRIPKKQLSISSYPKSVNQDLVILASSQSSTREKSANYIERTIVGTVFDEYNEPLPGVNVFVKGTTIGTVTDTEGAYSLSVPDNADILVFSFIGYSTEEAAIGTRSVIDISMTLDIATLQEIVVVGYGTTQKKDLTGSVATIDTDNISNMPAPRIEQALAGKAAGLQITNSDPSPGTAPTIRIRGNNSLTGNNNPLIVIDGVLGADLQSLNPNDVASVQILKDASATAIYGSRGANGVIIVTTKRGESGKTIFNFSSAVGFQEMLDKIDVLNAQEHLSLLDASIAFTVPPDFSPSTPGGFAIDNPILSGDGVDWQDEIYQKGIFQNYHLSVSGGSESTRFAVLGEYLDQEGIVKSSNYEKIGVRVNVDHEISEKVRVGNSMNAFRTVTNGIVQNGRGGGLSTNILNWSPIVPVLASDGTYNDEISGGIADNPREVVDIRENINTRNYFLNNLFLEWDIIPNLTFKVSGTYINQSREIKTYVPGDLWEARADSGRAAITNRRNDEWLIENTLNYAKTFGKHRFNSVVGFTAQTFNNFRTSLTGAGFSTDALGFNGLGLATNILAPSTNKTENTIASFLGRVAYVYNDKYMLTLSGRADGASVFAVNNKWAFFPAVAASWVISSEDFMSNVGALSSLKLRVGYGETGSQAIDPYQSLSALSVGGNGGYTLGQNYFTNEINIATLGNGGLRWETTAQTNVGLDLGILGERITFTADYYYKKTRDLLFDQIPPLAAGLDRQVQNVGDMENWGWEFSTEARVIDSELKWDVTANISFLNNEVSELGQDSVLFLDGSLSSVGGGFRPNGIIRPGEPIGQFYGFLYDGIFQSDAEASASAQAGARPGDARYVNVNGDTLFNEDDKVVIGNALPDFIFGFTSTWAYKNFDLSVAIQGSIGNDIAYLGRALLERPGDIRNGLKETLNYWTPDNPTNDMVAIDREFDLISDRFIEDGSFVRFRNISLGYNLPTSILEKLKLQSLRVYASAINWLTITNYSGYDPEVNSRSGDTNDLSRNVLLGYDLGAYPGSKQLVFGMNLGF